MRMRIVRRCYDVINRVVLDSKAIVKFVKKKKTELAMSKASGSHTGRPRESVVWKYFFYDSTKAKSICQVESGATICGAEINAKYTTNLKAHLKSRHPDCYAEVCKEEGKG